MQQICYRIIHIVSSQWSARILIPYDTQHSNHNWIQTTTISPTCHDSIKGHTTQTTTRLANITARQLCTLNNQTNRSRQQVKSTRNGGRLLKAAKQRLPKAKYNESNNKKQNKTDMSRQITNKTIDNRQEFNNWLNRKLRSWIFL